MEEPQSARVGFSRQLARKVLKDAKAEEIPVKLGKIVTYFKNIKVFSRPFTGDMEGIEVCDGENSYIGYKEDNPVVRKRSTLAHELGHSFLSHNNPNNSCRNNVEEKVIENEAWAFAREILMPIKIFKKEYKANPDLSYLAFKFWVSKEMITTRLLELNLCK